MAFTVNNGSEYRICSRCIMDTTSDPDLVLDDKGMVIVIKIFLVVAVFYDTEIIRSVNIQ